MNAEIRKSMGNPETVEGPCLACGKFAVQKVRYAGGDAFLTCPLCGKETSLKGAMCKGLEQRHYKHLSRFIDVPKTRH